MIDYFKPVPNDESLYYLSKIFGSMTEGEGLLPGGNTISILGVMFDTFNEIILGVGALIVIYITVMGVVMSAHEGEFMKKWNSLWVPLRAVFGIAALFPTPTGYSFLQIAMMWVIIQGVGAADTLWTTALSYAEAMGTVTAQIGPPSVGVRSSMGNLFKALTCEESARLNNNLPVETENNVGAFFCYGNVPAWCLQSIISLPLELMPASLGPLGGGNNFNNLGEDGIKKFGPDNGSCGKMYFCSLDDKCFGETENTRGKALEQEEKNPLSPEEKVIKAKTCAVCKAQIATLGSIIKALRASAKMYAQLDFEYMQYFYKGYYVDWLGRYTEDKEKYPRPAFVSAYCNSPANKVPDKDCHGTMSMNFSEEKEIQEGKKKIGSDESLKRAERRGSLPDARVGYDSPALAVVSEVIWEYGMKPELGGIDQVEVASNEYMAMINANMDVGTVEENSTAGTKKQIKATPPTGILLMAQQKGWIAAGGFYYFLIKDTGNKLKNSLPRLEVIAVHPSAASEDSGIPTTMKTKRNNYSAAGALIKIMSGDKPGDYGGASMAALGEGMDSVNQMMQSSMDNKKSVNPLIQLAASGYKLLTDAQIIFATFLVLIFLVGLIAGINFFVLGTGTTNPMNVAYQVFMMAFIPLLGMLLSLMITMGATLCIYVPMIPYMIFTFGAVGWMLSTIEAMVAGPLVALGILAPGGHSEMLGKAEPALLLLFNIFLRPSLMIFGLIASMLVSAQVVVMVNGAFWPLVYPQITSMARTGGETIEQGRTSVTSPLVLLFFMIAYVGVLVAVLNKSFAAIYIIPENVMRWIGGHGDRYGEEQSLGGVQSKVEGEATRTGERASGMTSGAESRGGQAAKKEGQKPEEPNVEGGKGGKPPSGSGSGGS